MMEKQQTAKDRYDARTAFYVRMKLNKGTDSDIIAKLEAVENKQAYIKALIRGDLAK